MEEASYVQLSALRNDDGCGCRADLLHHHRPGHSAAFACSLLAGSLAAQQMSTETRDPNQKQDPTFAKSYMEWPPNPKLGSPLVDHLPLADGMPTPSDLLGYHVGAPRKLTYYADLLRDYRAPAAATPRVKVETIGRSNEGREPVMVWVSSEANMAALDANRKNLATIADPRGNTPEQIAAA